MSETTSNTTITRCQHCGELTNYAGDPHHRAREDRHARAVGLLRQVFDQADRPAGPTAYLITQIADFLGIGGFDEERADFIGQNGNEGEHYEPPMMMGPGLNDLRGQIVRRSEERNRWRSKQAALEQRIERLTEIVKEKDEAIYHLGLEIKGWQKREKERAGNADHTVHVLERANKRLRVLHATQRDNIKFLQEQRDGAGETITRLRNRIALLEDDNKALLAQVGEAKKQREGLTAQLDEANRRAPTAEDVPPGLKPWNAYAAERGMVWAKTSPPLSHGDDYRYRRYTLNGEVYGDKPAPEYDLFIKR